MREGKLQIYCGSGKGKTTAALGQAIKEASLGRSVFIVQFMKCRKADEEISFIQRLEPEIKLFRFQRREAAFEDLAPEEQQEEIMNMKNGLNFAKKVLATGECDVLILDEVLGLIDKGILTIEELKALIEAGDGDTELMLTGIRMYEELYPCVEDVFCIDTLK